MGTPIGDMNRYVYASGDGVSNKDPSGLFSLSEISISTAIVGVFATLSIGGSATLVARDIRSLQQTLPSTTDLYKLPGQHNGPADAFRHCTAGCRIASKWGWIVANLANAGYEGYEYVDDVIFRAAEDPELATQENKMDLFNTNYGANLAESCDNPGQCFSKCYDAAKGEKLYYLLPKSLWKGGMQWDN